MVRIHENTANIEIVIAMLGAAGMIITMVNPLIGRLILTITLAMLTIFYLAIGVGWKPPANENAFVKSLGRINFLCAGLVAAASVVLVNWLTGNLFIWLVSLGILVICLALNTANKYLYRIPDSDLIYKQIRLVMLGALLVLIFFVGIK